MYKYQFIIASADVAYSKESAINSMEAYIYICDAHIV